MEINEERLLKYVERVKNFIKREPKMNEPNTKMKVIRPLFELIGWNFASENVEAEHPIQVGSTIAHVDYALKIDNKPVVLIEAKGFDSDLDEKFKKQAYSYSRISKVKWFILTNGKELHLYNSDWGDDFDRSLVFKGKVNDYSDLIDEFSLLSPNSLKVNLLENGANKLWYTRNVKKFIKKNPEKVARRIASWVQGEIGGWNKKDVELALEELIKKKMKEKQKKVIKKIEPKIPKKEILSKDEKSSQPYSIDYYFKNKEKTKELFDKLQLRIAELGDEVEFYCTAKNYLSLRILGKSKVPPNIVTFRPKVKFLKMEIKLDSSDVIEKKDLIKDISDICWWWRRGCQEVRLRNEEDIDYVFSLIKKAFEREKSAHPDLIEGV